MARVAREQHGDYGDEAAALVLFAAYTGVRPGELAALRWCDLEISDRRAPISRALDGQGGIKPPKNGKPRRTVLPPQALRALSELARPLDKQDLIFHTPRGKRADDGDAHLPVATDSCSLARQRWPGSRPTRAPSRMRDAAARAWPRAGRRLRPLGHTDGGRLVMTLYGHPDEDRARDRLDLAFAADGHDESESHGRLGCNSGTGCH